MDKVLSLKLKNNYRIKKDRDESVTQNERDFCLLMDEYKEYLYRIAYAYVKDENVALEIIQETTFKAYKNISKLKETSYFKTWVTRILINTSISVMRSNKKLITLEQVKIKNEIKASISSEEKIDLYNAIDLLDKKYKMVIILKYFNDMKIREISMIMNVPEGTIKTYLKRAKEALSRELGEGYIHE